MQSLSRTLFALVMLFGVMILPPAALAQSADTDFDPAIHGFKFNNTFKNIVFHDIHSGGLCGGMVYAALDYFYDSSKPLPTQFFPPQEGEPLRQYFYDKTTEAIVKNLDRWIEFGVNPGGMHNNRFFELGVNRNSSDWTRLREWIDSGRPVPIGLQSCDGQFCKGNHVMLAIGYRMGRDKYDLEIKVYDPNNHSRKLTLVPDPGRKQFVVRELEGSDWAERWQAWFVQTSYSRSQAPKVTFPVYPSDNMAHAIVVQFMTGNDDLRGGDDNVHVKLTSWQGHEYEFLNVNKQRRWIADEDQWVFLPLNRGVPTNYFKDITLSTTFGGGIGGDNWDLSLIRVFAVGRRADGSELVERIGGFPGDEVRNPFLHRFTGQSKTLTRVINGTNPIRAVVRLEPTTLEQNFGRVVNPYQVMTVSPDQYRTRCQRVCQEQGRCKAWTYVRNANKCMLSEQIGRKYSDRNSASGLKLQYLAEDLRQ